MIEKRVLVVDDSKDIGRMIAAALGTLDPGVQVRMMSSAEEAVLEITRELFDLLVIDIRLPGISGLDLTRRIRSRNPNLKIIQISGLDDPQVATEALQAGANAFFHKPISMSEFLKTTGVFLGLRAAEPEVHVAVDFQSESEAGKIADVLSAVRKSLNAVSVAMIDSRGHLMMQAGKLPDPNLEFSLIPELVVTLQTSARVGVRLGELQPEHVLGFRGPTFQLVAAPIYAGYSLLIFLKAEKPSLRMAIAIEEALLAQQELYKLLQGVQPAGEATPGESMLAPQVLEQAPPPPAVEPRQVVPPAVQQEEVVSVTAELKAAAAPPPPAKPRVAQPPTPEPAKDASSSKKPAETPPPAPAKESEPHKLKPQAQPEPAPAPAVPAVEKPSIEESLESLLRASADRRLEPGEIDAFWDDLAAQENPGAAENPGVISYEQAIKMGLAPKEGNK